MIARPSYGGEREPDSHPTPGPPTVVQSARVQLPTLVLRLRNRRYRRIADAERADLDRDGVPDVFQEPPPGPPRTSADG